MSRRLTEATKKIGNTEENDTADPSILVQSLTGAMGEIEQIFGREATNEVMAKILTGTANGVTEESLLYSIQSGISGLSRLDPNDTKMKQLTDGFNKDLSLALDSELANQKLESKQTMSLSFAISNHFGSLAVPTESQMAQEDSSTQKAGATQSSSRSGIGETYEMAGFDTEGSWGTVKVGKLGEAAAEEIREAAEAGLDKATALTMASIMKQESGEVFLAHFLRSWRKIYKTRKPLFLWTIASVIHIPMQVARPQRWLKCSVKFTAK
jgi:hypothetical protein